MPGTTVKVRSSQGGEFDCYLALPSGAQAFNKAFPIHASKVGGWTWRILLTVSGLSLTLLGSLAVWTFWFKRPKPAKRVVKKAALAAS